MTRLPTGFSPQTLAGLFFLTMVCSALYAEMEVYQCEDERGRMALSDRPCEVFDPDFEFTNMRTVETYGSPRTPAESAGGAGARVTAPAARIPSPKKREDCEPADENSPWIRQVGRDDCKPKDR